MRIRYSTTGFSGDYMHKPEVVGADEDVTNLLFPWFCEVEIL